MLSPLSRPQGSAELSAAAAPTMIELLSYRSRIQQKRRRLWLVGGTISAVVIVALFSLLQTDAPTQNTTQPVEANSSDVFSGNLPSQAVINPEASPNGIELTASASEATPDSNRMVVAETAMIPPAEVITDRVEPIQVPVIPSPATMPRIVVKEVPVQPAPVATTQATPPVVISEPVAPPQITVTENMASIEPAAPAVTAPKVAEVVPPARNILADAEKASRAGNLGSALAAYDELLAEDVGNKAAVIGKMRTLMRGGQYQAAANIGRDWLAQRSGDNQVRAAYVQALSNLSAASAGATLREIAAAQADFAPAQAALGTWQTKYGRPADALRSLQRAAQLAPDNANYQLSLALLYEQMGRGSDALAAYRAVLATKNFDDLSLSEAAIRQRIAALSR